MSETSEDKTKRKYLNVLLGNQWNYQYSVFYADAEESELLRTDLPVFKKALSRLKQPFLTRVQLLHRNGVTQAYLTMFTTEKMKASELASLHPANVNVISRTASDDLLSKKARTIAIERPHDLEAFFNQKGVNRWSVVNKRYLQPLEAPQVIADDAGADNDEEAALLAEIDW